MTNNIDINRFYSLLESTIGNIKPLLSEQQTQKVNNVNLTSSTANWFDTTINKLNGKQILDLANSWGWKGEFLNGPFDKNTVNDTTINASKEFLKSIGWPKFGDPNSKKTNTVDVNKIISQSKQELEQKKYAGLYGQGTASDEKINNSNIPYNLCLKNVKENISNMSVKDLQKYDSVESYCKSNWTLYDFEKHVEKYGGVHGFFESVREFLLSPSGVATQIALSFTGVGNIATIVVWAIMLIYDCFAISMGKSNWFNIIIDVISLATAGKGGGIIGKLISKFGPEIGAGFNTLINKVITYLSESKLGKWVIESVKASLEKMTSLVDDGYKVMKTTFNIKWVDKTIGTVKQWLNNIVQWFKKLELQKIPEKIGEKIASKVTSSVAKGTIQKFVTSVFGKNTAFTKSLIQGMENLTQEQIKKATGQYIEDVSVKLAKKQAEDMKNATIEDVLIAIDSKFGTKMSKLFMVYVYGKKFGKEVTNVSTGKTIDKVNYTVDAARGDYYLNKLGDYNNKLAAIVGPDFQNL